MAKGDGGGMMGRVRNAAMQGGNMIGAMKGQPPGGFAQANPNFGGGRGNMMGRMGMGMARGNPMFGQGQMGNTPAMSYGGQQGGGGMVGPSMPQITPNPEFEKAYGGFRDQGMDFPGAMDAAQNQMGGSRGNMMGRGIRAPMGGFGRGRGMMF